MNFLNRLSLTTRLTVVFVAIGTIPLVAMGLYAIKGLKSSDAIAIENLHSRAEAAMDKIERNLFERYGDVQAFGLNAAVFNKADWHKPGAEANAVVRAANSYVQLYGIYALSLVVDTEGKVIAVNDKNAAGQPIDTKALYSRNFANETWFKKSMAGEFLKSDILNGTHVEDVNIDEDVKTITGGSGLNVGFAAPVKGLDGKIIGVWLNRADFSVVEEIIGAVYKDLLRSGRGTAEITALDRSGRVIIDYDPATRGGKLEFQHDTNVIFKLNLAENNVAAAKALIAGQSGAMDSRHSRKGVDQAVGFAKSKGALGYPGLGWGIMIRVGTSEAYAASNRATLVLAVNLAAAIILIAVIAFRFGRSTARPMLDGIDNLRRLGEAVASSSTQVAAASQSIADSASQQAASLEETSASITELASMTARSKEQAQAAKNFSDQTKSTATAGNDDVKAMAEAMDQIRKAGEEVRLAIADIQASGTEVSRIVRTIDEIAFQTNILALNAAVEAARAGEAGLGFAVVADEVRNLAQRSARAAKETSELIDTSNRKSELGAQVSRRLDESLRAVEQSAKKVRVRFAEIAAQTTDVDKAMAEIAAATRDQADGLSQINKAVSSMDEITQSNAAGAEESAAAANELRTYAADVWHAVESMRAVVTGAVEAPPAVRANGAEPSPKQNVKKPAAPAPKPQHVFHRRTAEEPNLYSLESSARSESQTAQSQDDAFASLPMREIKGSADTKVRPRANPGDFRDF